MKRGLRDGLGAPVYGPLVITVMLVMKILLVFSVPCSDCSINKTLVGVFLTPTATYLTITVCAGVSILGGC